MPNAWLAAPFVFLGTLPPRILFQAGRLTIPAGLAPEGGSSVTFVNRMGLAKANEALIFGRKLSSEDLERCGFVKYVEFVLAMCLCV